MTLLSTLSPARQPAAVSTVSQRPDPSKHSAVCCCSLCEQRGTGEQAMRAARGDYRRFLRFVGSLSPLPGSPPAQTNSANKPSRWAAGPSISNPR